MNAFANIHRHTSHNHVHVENVNKQNDAPNEWIRFNYKLFNYMNTITSIFAISLLWGGFFSSKHTVHFWWNFQVRCRCMNTVQYDGIEVSIIIMVAIIVIGFECVRVQVFSFSLWSAIRFMWYGVIYHTYAAIHCQRMTSTIFCTTFPCATLTFVRAFRSLIFHFPIFALKFLNQFKWAYEFKWEHTVCV